MTPSHTRLVDGVGKITHMWSHIEQLEGGWTYKHDDLLLLPICLVLGLNPIGFVSNQLSFFVGLVYENMTDRNWGLILS